MTLRSSFALALVFSSPLGVRAQVADTVDIGMLVDQLIPGFEAIASQMVDEISAVVGPSAVIRFSRANLRTHEYDLSRAEQLYEELVGSGVEIVLAAGPVTVTALSRRTAFPTPTILFGSLNRDVIDVRGDESTSGVDNLTYVVTTQSYERDLTTLRSLYAFQRVGVLMMEAQLQVPEIRADLDQQFQRLSLDYELIPYTTVAALGPYLERVDALYLAESYGIEPEELRQIADELLVRRLPSFSAARREDVEMGFLATNAPAESMDLFLRRIALHVEAIVDGQNLSERPVFLDVNEALTINFNTAELVGVPIKYSLIATTEFVGDFVNVLSERTYTLAEAVEQARAQNPLLSADRLGTALSETDIDAAWSAYLPSVSMIGSGNVVDPDLAQLSGGQNPQYSALGSLVLSQAIFSPQTNANISIQRSRLRAQEEDVRAAELDLVLDVANAYLNALILKANLQIRSQNLDLTRRNLLIAEQNNEAGQVGRGDVLRLESAAASDRQALVEAINQLEGAFYALNQLLDNPVNREIDVVDQWAGQGVLEGSAYGQLQGWLDDPSTRVALEDFLVQEAQQNAPELRALDHNLDASERTISLFGAQRFLPTLAAQAQYNRTFDQGGVGAPGPEVPAVPAYYTLGFQASIPLFDSNSRNIDRAAARIQRDQLQLNRDYATGAIERGVRELVLELTNQVANIELSGVSERAAAEALDLTQAAYSNGAVGIVDLLDAQTSHLQARLASASATYTFVAASLALGRQIGTYFLLTGNGPDESFLQRFQEFRARRADPSGA